MQVEKYLLGKGLKPHIKGFWYIVEAINLVRQDKIYLREVCSKLYPEIAEKYKDTASKVERAIRHSIFSAGTKMTNAEFIALAEIETR